MKPAIKRMFCIIIAAFAVLCLPLETMGAPKSIRRTVKIGFFQAPGFYELDAYGERSGYGCEYDQMVAQYAGWDIEYVDGTWDELQSMLTNGTIDILDFAVRTDERELVWDFTQVPSGTSMSCLITTADNDTYNYQDYDSFDNMTVAMVKSNANEDRIVQYCQQHDCQLDIKEYSSYSEVYAALDCKEVQAGVLTDYNAVSEYKIIDKFLPTDFFYCTTKGNTELLNQLDQALTQIGMYYTDYNSTLYSKYYESNGRLSFFSSEELEYMDTQPVVYVVPGGRAAPYEHCNSKGEYSGIVPDVLDRISEITGISFEYSDKADVKGNNIITAVTNDIKWTGDRGLYMTQPFVYSTIVTVSKENEPEISKVAVVKDSYINDLITTEYPQYVIVNYDSASECMDAVKSGKVDCAIMNNYEAEYYLDMGKYQSLKEQIASDSQQNICFGIDYNSDEQLFGIISKSLTMIDNNDYKDILRYNVASGKTSSIVELIYTDPIQLIIIFFIIIVLVMMILILFINNRHNTERNRYLQELNQSVENANKAKTDFLARMSHDIRTPMNAIIGLTSLTLDDVNKPEIVRDNLNKIRSSSDFLLGLMNDVLDMSKIEDNSFSLNTGPYAYEDFLANIRTMFEPMCAQHGITFSFEEVKSALVVMTDKVRLNQIFFNIISNAIKYTPEGGTVSYYTRNLVFNEKRVSCDYYIEDTGVGMSEEFQQHMFEPFTQEDTRVTSQLQGSGLGLSITGSLVRLMGGTIKVNSTKGKGTTVIIHLEFDIASDKVLQPEANADTGSEDEVLAGSKVLLVEDHPLNAEIATRLLERKSVTVFYAKDGVQAVQKYQSCNPGFFDAILMDIRMPNMNGLDAAKAIRASGRSDALTIPIIAMTANAYKEDVEATKEAGMNEHISKPIDVATLYTVLAGLISLHNN